MGRSAALGANSSSTLSPETLFAAELDAEQREHHAERLDGAAQGTSALPVTVAATPAMRTIR